MNLENFITPLGEKNNFNATPFALEFLNELSPEQKQVVIDKNNNQIISAGAGSGKTRVLTYKIAYLILTGVKPSEILALTFTNKAAKEMKERIVKLLDHYVLNDLWMGTFHSIFLKILRENPDFIKSRNVGENFTIIDQKSKNSILEIIIRKYIKEYENAKEKNDMKKLQDILYEISDIISKVKNEGKTVFEYLDDKEEDDFNYYSKDNIKKIYRNYRTKCNSMNSIDFDDILLYTYKMLSDNENICQKYKNKFKYILIDEYQDTNAIQFNIIDLILGKGTKVCAVGDESQCIYSFRGSKIENIQKFKEKYSPFEYKLTINYRSTKTIVGASNKLIKENKGQSPKILFSNDKSNNLKDSKIKIISSSNEKEEAEKVIDKIIELKNEDKEKNNFGSFAILYRTHKQSEPFESKLKKRGVPYKIIGKIPFLDRDIISLIISYIKIILNEKDEISLQKIKINQKVKEFINLLKKKIWEKEPLYFIEKIVDFITQSNSYSLNNEDMQLIISLKNIAKYLTNKYHQNQIKYSKNDSLEEEEEEIKSDNKNSLILYNLKEFLDDLILLNLNEDITENISNIDNISENQMVQNNSNKVKLMTIHSSKGLEFNTVFIVGVEEGFYPIYNDKIKEENLNKHIEEERRMFYVALTRAKQNCFISYANNRLTANNKYIKRKKSRFINELEIENGNKYLDFTDEIINNDNNIQNNFIKFNNSSFNQFSNKNSINSYKNYKLKNSSNNAMNFYNKHKNSFSKSDSHNFLCKKRFKSEN